MKVLKQNQYNQGVGKYKLLSSTSGVGSIITTKQGSYVLISDINKWWFVEKVNLEVKNIRSKKSDDREVYNDSRDEVIKKGLEFVDDLRFIKFIRSEKGLEKLVCLVGIPHMSLNEAFNTPNWNNHPIKAALEKANEPFKGLSENYMIKELYFQSGLKITKEN